MRSLRLEVQHLSRLTQCRRIKVLPQDDYSQTSSSAGSPCLVVKTLNYFMPAHFITVRALLLLSIPVRGTPEPARRTIPHEVQLSHVPSLTLFECGLFKNPLRCSLGCLTYGLASLVMHRTREERALSREHCNVRNGMHPMESDNSTNTTMDGSNEYAAIML